MKAFWDIFGITTFIHTKFAEKQFYVIKRLKFLIDSSDDYNYKGGSFSMLYKR